MRPPLAVPPATDPAVLAIQLAAHVPPQAGAKALLTAVADVNTTYYLDREQRAAVLRVVATVDGVTYRTRVVDIAGPTGVAVDLTEHGSTTTLIFHPGTGELLAHQEVVTTRPAGLFGYRLYLDRDQREHLDAGQP